MPVEIIIHWLHLIAAIVWIGGMIFTALVLMPVVRKDLPPQIRYPLFKKVGKRFSKVGWIAFAVLLITGTYKLIPYWESTDVFQSGIGMLLLLKIALVAVVVLLSFLHDFIWGPEISNFKESDDPGKFKELTARLSFWSRINLAAGIGITALGTTIARSSF